MRHVYAYVSCMSIMLQLVLQETQVVCVLHICLQLLYVQGKQQNTWELVVLLHEPLGSLRLALVMSTANAHFNKSHCTASTQIQGICMNFYLIAGGYQ